MEENEYPSIEFSLVSDGENKEEEINKIIEVRNQLLREKGYIVKDDGSIVLPEEKKREKEEIEKTNKIMGGLVGFAVGDAMGVPVEFTARKNKDDEFLTEMVGYGSHQVPEGTWSDDTSMMLATMDSLVNCNSVNYENIMNEFINWVNSAKYTATNKVFDIGMATRSALQSYFSGKTEPIKSGGTGEMDNGNGSLMRILPIGIYLADSNISDEEKTEIINNVSSLTHAHEISKMGCKLFCDLVDEFIHGKNKIEAYESICKKDYSKYYSKATIDKYERILNGKINNLDINEISSSGYVVDTLESVIWVTLYSQDYESAVINAINLGNDTDTVGAITGGLNGIIYEYNRIPERWLNKMQNKDYLINMCQNFNEWLKKKKNVDNDGIINDNKEVIRKI